MVERFSRWCHVLFHVGNVRSANALPDRRHADSRNVEVGKNTCYRTCDDIFVHSSKIDRADAAAITYRCYPTRCADFVQLQPDIICMNERMHVHVHESWGRINCPRHRQRFSPPRAEDSVPPQRPGRCERQYRVDRRYLLLRPQDVHPLGASHSEAHTFQVLLAGPPLVRGHQRQVAGALLSRETRATDRTRTNVEWPRVWGLCHS